MEDAFDSLPQAIEHPIIARTILGFLIPSLGRQNPVASLLKYLILPLCPDKSFVANDHSVSEIIYHRFGRQAFIGIGRD